MAIDPPHGNRPPVPAAKPPSAESKPRGANRSTKVAGKLQVLPDQPDVPTQSTILQGKAKPKHTQIAEAAAQTEALSPSTADSDEDDADDEEEETEEQDAEVYTQIAQIPEGTARRDALRLTKKKAKSLPRVTAYATAASYRMADLMKFFQARGSAYHTNPRLIDEVLYTTYSYNTSSSDSKSHAWSPSQEASRTKIGDLLNVPDILIQQHDGPADNSSQKKKDRKRRKFDAGGSNDAEIFMFEYGTVVIWGMSEAEEKRFLSSIKRFEVERLPPEDMEMEDLNYYYANYSRIFNDVITLRRGSGFMTKLSLSHALAQSVKISLFEMLISSNIEHTKDVPEIISETGKVGMPHKEIMQQIGELFLLRMNINLVGSVLDVPEIFWSYPDLQPLYEAARSYLEIPQRVHLLNTRVEVLQDMLQLLKESVSSKHSERLEQIVIALIGVEIVLGIVTIIVDLFS
ncbi:DUF155-domain-containing protein [Fomitiporia mediterranea MF3/22]|uniref:DUF155-domain-containing protein n=1 Tax=Fomitiporia mediterranea (strain MF3/22) TaxID=694068 RepID=UPI0004408CF3|nr:DUF155-domain-containing protein [Fomitiporia mediterranea MF3/22]EJD05487.1 DUF155-domain-containing protein [Fomitiporia mediterranea MF3/22]